MHPIAIDTPGQLCEIVIAAFAWSIVKKKTEKYMTLGEFRRMYGVPARTLRYWISTGRIHVMKISNGRGGFSKRIKRPETLADLIALEKSFIKARSASGPRFRLPLPKDKAFRAAVQEFTSAMQKKGEAYRKKGKPLVAQWRAVLTACKWEIPTEEVERTILNQAGKVPL